MVCRSHHRSGRAELVRFWGDAPLVREPTSTLFGLERLDPPEQEFSPNRRCGQHGRCGYSAEGRCKAATMRLIQVHADARELFCTSNIDVIAKKIFRP